MAIPAVPMAPALCRVDLFAPEFLQWVLTYTLLHKSCMYKLQCCDLKNDRQSHGMKYKVQYRIGQDILLSYKAVHTVLVYVCSSCDHDCSIAHMYIDSHFKHWLC